MVVVQYLCCETSVCSCIAGKGTTITAILLYRNTLTSQRSEESCKADFLYLILINGSSHHISYLILLHARGDMYNHLVFHHTFGTAAAPWKLIYGCERHLLRAFSVYAMVTLPPSSAAITVDSRNQETAAELEKPSVVWGTFNCTFIYIVGKTVGKHCNDYNNATQNDNTNNSSHKWVNKKFPIKVTAGLQHWANYTSIHKVCTPHAAACASLCVCKRTRQVVAF